MKNLKGTLNLIKSDLSRLEKFKEKKINLFSVIISFLGSKNAQAVILYRLAHYFGEKSNLLGILITNYSVRTTGCEIKHKAKIGKGFRMFHTVGIVISDSTNIGDNFTIYQGITVGKKNRNTFNNIGDNVQVYANATILANIIGDNSLIAAGSVVLNDVPSNCVVAGVPAKVIYKRELENAQ